MHELKSIPDKPSRILMANLRRDTTWRKCKRCEMHVDVIASFYMRAFAGEEVPDVMNWRHQSCCGHVIRFQVL